MTSLEKLLVWTVLGNVLLLAVFYTRLRFRVPLDAVMITSSAAALAELMAGATRLPDRPGGRVDQKPSSTVPIKTQTATIDGSTP